MRRDPLVTVVIPSYNHACFLGAAIDSVLAQTYRELELVIVDDGSTDDSLLIAQSYAERFPTTIRVLTHSGRQHRGISATINATLVAARGEYWSAFASDDLLAPTKLAERLRARDLRTAPITTPQGVLIGIVRREDLEQEADSG